MKKRLLNLIVFVLLFGAGPPSLLAKFTGSELFDSNTLITENTVEATIEGPVVTGCGTYDVPITVSNFTDVGAISLKLNYNNADLIYAGVTLNTTYLTVNNTNAAVAGEFTLGYHGDPISIPDGEALFTLHFVVEPSLAGTPFELTWADDVPGNCEFAGEGGAPVYESSFYDFSATIITDEMPEIICPGDITVNNNAGECGAVVTYATPIGTDNCPNPVTTQTAGLPSGSFFSVGETVNTFEVRDSQGNKSTCSFTVTVADAELPVLTCVGVQTKATDAGACSYTVVGNEFDFLTVDDNCTDILNADVEYELSGATTGTGSETMDGVSFGKGETTVTWKATDETGNVGTCSFVVTVNDTELPSITCVGNQSKSTDPGVCTYTAKAGEFDFLAVDDNCTTISPASVEYVLNGATTGSGYQTLDNVLFQKGVTTVTWKATDEALNAETCTFDVTVSDTEFPKLEVVEDQIVSTDDGVCTYTVTGNEFDFATATDNCTNILASSVEYELTDATTGNGSETLAGVVFEKGVTTLTWSASDESNNVTSASFKVTVEDNEGPVITTCPPDRSAIVTDGCSVQLPDFTANVEASDNCGVVSSVVQSPASGTWMDFDETSYTVTITVTDDAGNTTECYPKFTVEKATVSGNVIYNNAGQSPMANVVVDLLDAGGNSVGSTVTSEPNGAFEFSDLCAGDYTIVASDTSKVGYINATDAGAANAWNASGGAIEYVNFLAGDVTNDYNINHVDPQRIQSYFVTGESFDRNPWSFWLEGLTISNNASDPSTLPRNMTVTVSGANVSQNILAMATGDFNGSFGPTLKSAGSSVRLSADRNMNVEENQVFNLPLRSEFAMEVGAVSLILDLPSDFAQVMGVKVNGSEVPAIWAVKDNELRIGWNSFNPVYVGANEALVTLQLKSGEGVSEGQIMDIGLVNNPLNEVADGNFNPIRGASLLIAKAGNGLVGVNEELNIDELSFSNYPNPFSRSTTLSYAIPEDGRVNISIYNQLGQLVTSVVDVNQKAGQYTIENCGGNLLPGMYVAKLRLTNESDIMVGAIKLNVIK
ncbi:Por secretion system C-terminal sorting domain-containing protein [Tangfeifania diversioriginum]|uniref:Por secretion system C-terminal sorting domain-containing protein n=1 Tax=Tangfeifania diversioriginum TaxID=1168035 RepID=A0A1M6GZA5_9BACT|nr:HYR domain-containing protein [Tangfeifania diversioriginum]SHJ15281.1 Por secretion system C-terminal sorting domain-containing protein [Tangfeifania diversioriginum]